MFLLVVLVFFAVFTLVFALSKKTKDNVIYQRLKDMVDKGQKPDSRKAELSRSLTERLVAPFIAKLAIMLANTFPQERFQRLNTILEKAGYSWNISAGEWLAVKWVIRVTSGLIFVFIGSWINLSFARIIFMGILAAVTSGLLMDLNLKQKINLRKKSIIKELPDVLDLLTISIEAGLGFDGAMGKVVEKGKGNLANEFNRVLKEMEIGMSRQEALKELALRLEIDEIRSFANSIIQADQLGLGVGKVLRSQGQQVRQSRKQVAEETAMKAPIKMLFPLVFFIFPTIFLVLLGPAAIQLLKLFSSGVF